QRVGERGHVARRLPHSGRHEDGGVEADDVVAVLDHRPPPRLFDVALEQHAQGAVVPRGPEPPVDLARREDEPAPPRAARPAPPAGPRRGSAPPVPAPPPAPPGPPARRRAGTAPRLRPRRTSPPRRPPSRRSGRRRRGRATRPPGPAASRRTPR